MYISRPDHLSTHWVDHTIQTGLYCEVVKHIKIHSKIFHPHFFHDPLILDVINVWSFSSLVTGKTPMMMMMNNNYIYKEEDLHSTSNVSHLMGWRNLRFT